MKEGELMAVCCGHCHIKLESNSIVIMDELFTIKHFSCYDYPISIIETIGYYSTIKKQYKWLKLK